MHIFIVLISQVDEVRRVLFRLARQLEQFIHLPFALDLLLNGLDQTDLGVLDAIAQEWIRSLDQAFNLGFQGLLRMTLNHIYCLDMRLAWL